MQPVEALRNLYYAFAIPLSREMKLDAMEDAKEILDEETAHEGREQPGEDRRGDGSSTR